MSQSDLFRFDVRVRERMTRRGLLSESELEKHLGSLSDQEGRYDALPLTQPALLRVSEPPPPPSQPPPPQAAAAPVDVRPMVRRPEPAFEPPTPAPIAVEAPPPPPAPEPVRVAPTPMVPEPAPAAVPAVTSNPIAPEPPAPTPAPAPVQAAPQAEAEADNSAAGPESLPPETGELDEAWEKDNE